MKDRSRGWYHPNGWTNTGRPGITGSRLCKGVIRAGQEAEVRQYIINSLLRAVPAQGGAVIRDEEMPRLKVDRSACARGPEDRAGGLSGGGGISEKTGPVMTQPEEKTSAVDTVKNYEKNCQ